MSETTPEPEPEYYEFVLDADGNFSASVDMNKAMRDGMLLAGHAVEAREDMQAVFSLMNNSAADQNHASNVVAAYTVVRLTHVIGTLVGALEATGVAPSEVKKMLYEF
ncbi:hypothetical protein [Rhodococcus sp. 14-2470-1a]|uniref:hypothetical protein n=1 Tax=Rhodococcus sp. 14-2470-1a TaxID=2023150 RepID=UPI000B9B1368|nr:hypothetical protein [Rhodococcus sp. 14-2470-1a]OZF57018.1 hypothetical protein CH292_02000 [Rhodococcus sp. 14-2470-1a]